VYNILCDSLGVVPQPNNGTLRLPLKPVGLHSDEHAPPQVRPSDPPELLSATVTAGPSEPTSAATDAPSATEPASNDDTSNDDKGSTWWGTLTGKLEDFKQWAGQLFSAEKDNHPQQ
jgi:hypothetical protein